MRLQFSLDSEYVLLQRYVCWSLTHFFVSQNNQAEWKTLAKIMFRANPYVGVRDVVLAVILLRNLTYAPGSTQYSVLAEVESVITPNTENVRILRQLKNFRTTLRTVMKAACIAHEAVEIQERHDVGHIPSLGALTLENCKAPALLSRYYLAVLLASFSKDKALSLVSYTSVTTSDIAFTWVLLLSFAAGITWSGTRYSWAKVFIHAVYKPKNIVDWVLGHTEVLKPVVNVPAPARAASHDSSEEGSSSGSEDRDSDGSSSSSTSSEDEAPVTAPPIKRMRLQGTV
jgi:hypothetical protein